MKTTLEEVNIETCKLSTTNGKTYNVEPWDITVCCTWTATTEIEISSENGQKYCTNLSSSQKVRIC
ncbi:MAG: hypothetical protein RRY06_08610 [Lachnospiraceae bacterium]